MTRPHRDPPVPQRRRRVVSLGRLATALACAAILTACATGSGSAGGSHERRASTPRTVPSRIEVTPAEEAFFLSGVVRKDAADTAGSPEASNEVAKWTRDVRIAIAGTPTDVDRRRVADVAAALSLLMHPLEVRLAQSGDVTVHFTPRAAWPAVLHTSAVPADSDGVTAPSYATSGIEPGRFDSAQVVIDTALPQVVRNLVITHELLHAVGIGHLNCTSSVMYPKGGADTSPLWSLSPLDQAMVELLYRPALAPGMTAAAVQQVLVPTAPSGPSCDPPRWRLVRDQRGGFLFCERTGERYLPCTSDTTTEPHDPLPRVDGWFDGTFLSPRRPRR